MKLPYIPKGNYLVISNHISAFDFVLLNRINQKMFQHAKYAFKDSLKYFPVIYQAFLSINCLILKRNFEKDKERIIRYVKELKEWQLPVWFVLFCEGTRFTKARKVQADAFCKERGVAPFRNVLVPRHKGFETVLNELRGSYVRKVLDVTFYCKKEGVSAWDFLFSGEVLEFECDVRVVEMGEIEDAVEFVNEAFRRKDELIEGWRSET